MVFLADTNLGRFLFFNELLSKLGSCTLMDDILKLLCLLPVPVPPLALVGNFLLLNRSTEL